MYENRTERFEVGGPVMPREVEHPLATEEEKAVVALERIAVALETVAKNISDQLDRVIHVLMGGR